MKGHDLAAAARNRSFAKGNREQVSQILGWLPSDTETVVVAQEPFAIEDQNPRQRRDAMTTARLYATEPLEAVQEGALLKTLEGRQGGSTVRLSMLGARRFHDHAPDGSQVVPLGMVAHQSCGFYEFVTAVPPAIFGPGQPTSILGHATWVFQGRDYYQARDAKPTWDTYHLSLLNPDLMIVCNDRDFYATILTQIVKPGKLRALPESLPEWRQIGRASPFWAIRHFNPQRAEIDPTFSALADGDAGPSGGVGLTLQIGSPPNTVQARWLSPASANPWQGIAGDPQFVGAETKNVAKGVWQISIGASQPANSMIIFAVMCALGFTIVV